MGLNRTSLQRGDHGHFVGETLLPICSSRRMEWEARVLLQREQGWLAVPFRFVTER
jgi:hypothetical protein